MKITQRSHLKDSIGWLLVLALTSVGTIALMSVYFGVS
jgi:hypothetical protein